MRAKVQVCAIGNEEGISLIHTRLNLMGTTSFLKPTILTPENAGVLQWCSDFQQCQTEFPEDEISELLNTEMLSTLKDMRCYIDELMVVLVCEHESEPEDRPRGYTVSLNLIQLLAEVGASLEIDIVRDLR